MSGSAKKFEKPPKNQKLPIFGINLLIHKGETTKIQLRLLQWLVSSGKYIAIFVELIVIVAVIFKYKLDSDLIDLQKQINERSKFIQSLSADELLIRQTQFRLSTIKQIHTGNSDFASILFKISTLTPTRITLNNISFNHPSPNDAFKFSISGETPSNVELSVFIKALQKDPLFRDVILTNISFEEKTIFTITGDLVPQEGQKS